MNDLVKNLLVTLAVGLVLLTVFKSFTPAFQAPTTEVNYTTFLDDVRRSGRFALSILDERSRRAMTVFTRRPRGDESPFDKVAISSTGSGLPVLSDALAWLEGRVLGEHATADHVILFAEVVSAGVAREGEPHVHLRRNGLGY